MRSRTEFELALLDDLDWLGFEPDLATTSQFRGSQLPQRQSDNRARYNAVLSDLAARDLEYGCTCTRKDIASVTGDAFGTESRYPGTCAHAVPAHTDAVARRFRITSNVESFDDLRLGAQSQRPELQCGDFLLRDRNHNYTYQFCVTVDDWDQKIDLIVRGEDLLPSTGRQLQLARALGRKSMPLFLHHALLLRDDGLKLSKSLGDTGVNEMRKNGASPQEVLGRAAFASGLISEPSPIAASEVAELFA